MQIEKPKSIIPAWVLVVAVLVGGLLLVLPFSVRSVQNGGHSALSLDSTAAENSLSNQSQAASPQDFSGELARQLLAKSSEHTPETKKEKDVSASVSGPETKEEPLPQAVTFAKQPTSALMTSFYGDVRIVDSAGESHQAGKGQSIEAGETIEVGASGEAVIEIAELYVLRLKPNSAMTQLEPEKDAPYAGHDRVVHRFKLEKGALLGTTKNRTDKTDLLNLLVKDKVFSVQDSTFRVQLTDEDPWIGVMRGSLKSEIEKTGETPFTIRALERVSVTDQPLQAPTQVSQEEWGLLRETYEMTQKTAAEEALQIDLSKRAGDFFQYVFDHGNFYTENVGYTVRDFYEDEDSGEVYLEAEYDVFPANSFVGLYVLTRDLNARDYAGLRFEVRSKPGEGYPDRFFIELKSKGQIVHRFEITGIKPEWQARQIDFFTPASLPITEVTIVFLNENIGKTKKGYIQMRGLEMVALTEDQKARRAEAEKNPAVVPGSVPKALMSSPKSLQSAVVTEPVKQARRVLDATAEAVPYRVDDSKKIANEAPKIVSIDDLA